MDWKQIGRKLLFPPMAVLFLLFPLSLATMLYGMLQLGEDHPITIAFYALSFYTLTIWCVRVPELIRLCKTFKNENTYTSLWFQNDRLRMNVTLCGNALWNGAYAALQLGLGIYHHSLWFYALAAYYACLALMRFFLVGHTLRHEPGQELLRELGHYRTCGWVFLIINLAMSSMILLMITENRATPHHEITTIAMAAYTFTTLTMAIVNLVRHRRYNSPVVSAARAVSLTAACVSMLTLENTMLATFGTEEMPPQTRQIFLALSGGTAAFFIITMAIYMIVHGNKKLRNLENDYGTQ